MDPEIDVEDNNNGEVDGHTFEATPNNDNEVASDEEIDNNGPSSVGNNEDESLTTGTEQEKDEGIEEDSFKDDSKKDETETYNSSANDSLTENFGSLTTVEDETLPAVQESVTPPTERTPDPQECSAASPTSDNRKPSTKRSSIAKKKKKSNDFKPTVVKPFSFTTDKRIEDRQKYNEKVQKMQKAQEERERLERERREREEERLYQEERKKSIPKANPIRHYKPITITPSKKQLTMPDAPKLCLESRNRTPKVADKFESPPRGGSSNNKLKQVL